jgi:ketosteroid isomerase-like protein
VIKNEEIQLSGNFGFARGTYSALLVPKAGGEEIPIDGKYLTIFKKQADGTWKIYRDAFNSSVPPK